jgi:hypothetical protein
MGSVSLFRQNIRTIPFPSGPDNEATSSAIRVANNPLPFHRPIGPTRQTCYPQVTRYNAPDGTERAASRRWQRHWFGVSAVPRSFPGCKLGASGFAKSKD